MVSSVEPAVDVTGEKESESPEMARARQLASVIESLEQTLDPKPRSISGKRHSQRLADSRQLLESRIESIPDFERHSRKCQVCHSRYVEEIEEAYYNWSSAQWIINVFNISYDDAVYRHARAIGLDLRRRKNVAIAVEKLIEKVDEVTVTSSTVLRAVSALSCLTTDGRWTDLPTTHVVVTAKDLPAETTNSTASASTAPPNSLPNKSADVTVSSTERSEPPRSSDITIPEDGPSSRTDSQVWPSWRASSPHNTERAAADTSPKEANRGTMKN